MAIYKYAGFLQAGQNPEFDQGHQPAVKVPFSGIYRCTVCGREIAANAGDPFPPQNHSQHPVGKPIVWQMIVWADHNPK